MMTSKKNNKKNTHLIGTPTAIMIAILSLSLIFSNPIAFPSRGLQSAEASIVVRALNGGTIGVELPRSPAVVSGDNIYIAWWTNNTENGNEEVMFRSSNDGGETFGERINLSNTTDADSGRVEIAADGDNVAVTWWETNQTSDIPVARISNDAGQTFGPLLILGADGTIGIEVEPEEPQDTTPPTVVSTEPEDGATDVPIDTTITATFSEDVVGVDEDSFTVNGITGTVEYDSESGTATFTPDSDLDSQTTYIALLSSAIEDQAGNELEETEWSFTTIAASDTTPPTVVSTEPEDGATDVPIDTTITATFSEDVVGVDEDSFTVNNGTVNGTVQGEVTYDSATNTTTFTPSDELEHDTEYTATLTSAIEDQAGNELEEIEWSFTTITTAEDEEQEQQQ